MSIIVGTDPTVRAADVLRLNGALVTFPTATKTQQEVGHCSCVADALPVHQNSSIWRNSVSGMPAPRGGVGILHTTKEMYEANTVIPR